MDKFQSLHAAIDYQEPQSHLAAGMGAATRVQKQKMDNASKTAIRVAALGIPIASVRRENIDGIQRSRSPARLGEEHWENHLCPRPRLRMKREGERKRDVQSHHRASCSTRETSIRVKSSRRQEIKIRARWQIRSEVQHFVH